MRNLKYHLKSKIQERKWEGEFFKMGKRMWEKGTGEVGGSKMIKIQYICPRCPRSMELCPSAVY